MLSDMRLPILDLSRLDRGEAEAEAFRTELREATHEYGFFYLTGHGVPQELLDEAIRELPEAAPAGGSTV